jgi:hypothetical protein
LYSSVVVVPVFYGTYTALGLVNTIIYLDEITNYPGWAISLVFAGIGVLIYGVYLLSSKPDVTSHSYYDDSDHTNLDGSLQQQQQVVVIVPTEQEMHNISSSSASLAASKPPLYSTSSDLTKTTGTDEKTIPYPPFPSTAISKTLTIYSNPSSTSSPYQQQCLQPFESATLVDETIGDHKSQGHWHRRASSSTPSGKRWIQRILSRAPWRSIQRSEDTFLSLHSTDTTGRPISVAPPSAASTSIDNIIHAPIPSAIQHRGKNEPGSLIRCGRRTSHFSTLSDSQTIISTPPPDAFEKGI